MRIVRWEFPVVQLNRAADWLAVALVVSLPWSTTATGILLICWIVAVLPTFDRTTWHVAKIAALVLPVAIVAYAIVGVLWADITWPMRFRGVTPFAKLLVIPLLYIHFARSDASEWIFKGIFASLLVLLAASTIYALTQGLPRDSPYYGVPVKDYISQSGFFSLCGVVLLDRALSAWKTSPRTSLIWIAVALLFFANIAFVAAGRTTLVSLAALLALLGVRHFRKMTLAIFLGGLVAICAIAWTVSPYLRHRVLSVAEEVRDFRPNEVNTSSGARLEFWKQSVEIIRKAPLFGYGTGSTRAVMSRNAGVDPDATGAPSNPHNQILAVAIPLGLVGAALVLAMWIAHWRMFLAPGHVAWIGLAVVTQNIIGSLFNSHLFDFTQGWLYVLGVGVAGGALMRGKIAQSSNAAAASP